MLKATTSFAGFPKHARGLSLNRCLWLMFAVACVVLSGFTVRQNERRADSVQAGILHAWAYDAFENEMWHVAQPLVDLSRDEVLSHLKTKRPDWFCLASSDDEDPYLRDKLDRCDTCWLFGPNGQYGLQSLHYETRISGLSIMVLSVRSLQC